MRENNKPKTGVGKKNKKKANILSVCFIILLWLILSITAAFVIDRRSPVVRLNGDANIILEYGEQYAEPGCEALTTGTIFGDIWLDSMTVTTAGEVTGEQLGTYTITYSTKLLWEEASATRTITIQDTTAPVFTLTGNSNTSWLNGYQEEGYTAFDLHDGDLTGSVIREVSGESICYTVTDSSGNTAVAERLLNYIAAAPELQIIGEAELYLNCALSYNDQGCTATDNTGADLTQCIVTDNPVDPLTPGDYVITYSITNALGESVQAERQVHVSATGIPDTQYPQTKTIYLTFDDGPGPYTNALLNVLKKYNVKATFFVTNAMPSYRDCIGRAYREGHTIAVHTYTHEYDDIYASEEAYFDDFFKMQEIIYAQTGSYTRLFRFPGGSSNKVSRITPGLMTKLSTDLPNLGYAYFDWNVDSKDAGGAKTADEVLENVIEGCTPKRYSVVLQHDIKGFSVDAVESIILWGLKNGYTFSALQLYSPGVHHDLNN